MDWTNYIYKAFPNKPKGEVIANILDDMTGDQILDLIHNVSTDELHEIMCRMVVAYRIMTEDCNRLSEKLARIEDVLNE